MKGGRSIGAMALSCAAVACAILPTLVVASTATPMMTTSSAELARSSGRDRPVGGYIPKIWPTVVAAILYAISGALLWYQWRRMGKQKYMLALTIGMTTMVLGLIIRGIFHDYPYELIVYILSTLWVLLSPCAYLANQYLLLSRLSESLGEDIASSCLLIRSRLVVRIFVASDISTFLLQAAGGGISASDNYSTAQLGNRIVLAALILQMCSYILFLFLLISFVIRVRSKYPEAYFRASRSTFPSLKPIGFNKTYPIADWRLLFFTMLLTSVGIVTRSAFRVAEFTGGYNSYLATHEAYLYCLDLLPLWLAMSCYIFVWPPRLVLSPDQVDAVANHEKSGVVVSRNASKDEETEMGGIGGANTAAERS